MGTPQENKATVARFWETLYRKDWDAIAAFFADDAEYTDVPTPDDDVARGPAAIVARLRLGLDPVEEMIHHPKLVVAEDDTVITEHAEEWRFHTGERAVVRFCSVHEFRDDLIVRWWDYPDLDALLNNAPKWWLDHIMAGYEGGPPVDESMLGS
jgi:ketosteroid isomerase-like protein